MWYSRFFLKYSTQGILPYVPASSVTIKGSDAFWVPALLMWTVLACWTPVSFIWFPVSWNVWSCAFLWVFSSVGLSQSDDSDFRDRTREKGREEKSREWVWSSEMLFSFTGRRLAVFSWLLWTLVLLSWASNVFTCLSNFPYFCLFVLFYEKLLSSYLSANF